MATKGKNLSEEQLVSLTQPEKLKIGVVVSEWNNEITENLLKGAKETLEDLQVDTDNIHIHYVPGTFELALGAQYLLEHTEVQGVIALGSVIQGETKHFDFVCNGATNGIINVGLKYNKTVIFGVLTDNTLQQSRDRSGGKHGNKAIECAIACIKMIALKEKINSPKGKIGFSNHH